MEPKLDTIIALDYDGTAALCPRIWNEFAEQAKRFHGIEVIVVTARPEAEGSAEEIKNALPSIERIYHTAGVAKARFCEDKNIAVDIWVDDNPKHIHENLAPIIKKCTCGQYISGGFIEKTINGIPTKKCPGCGTLHQTLFMSKEQLVAFYRDEYHDAFQRSPLNKRNPTGAFVGSYSDRYKDDLKIAEMRLNKYTPYMSSGNQEALDIGSSNGAFVDHLKKSGFNSVGIDPGKNVSKNSENITQDLLEIGFPRSRFGLVTLHDVFEHLINPVEYLKEIHRITDTEGLVIIDLPDYWAKAGLHHWKLIQHLWFWTEKQLEELAQKNGFNVECIDAPVPGKKVFYLRKRPGFGY